MPRLLSRSFAARCAAASRSLQLGVDARQQLARVERLAHVVVGARGEALHRLVDASCRAVSRMMGVSASSGIAAAPAPAAARTAAASSRRRAPGPGRSSRARASACSPFFGLQHAGRCGRAAAEERRRSPRRPPPSGRAGRSVPRGSSWGGGVAAASAGRRGRRSAAAQRRSRPRGRLDGPRRCASPLGSSTRKVEPSPSLLCTEIVPPCSSPGPFTSASPMPVPPKRRMPCASAWAKRSKIDGRSALGDALAGVAHAHHRALRASPRARSPPSRGR